MWDCTKHARKVRGNMSRTELTLGQEIHDTLVDVSHPLGLLCRSCCKDSERFLGGDHLPSILPGCKRGREGGREGGRKREGMM